MIEKDIKNILILKWGALGDLIMSTSAVRAVRENFPDAKITMLTNHLMNEILPEGKFVDEYIFLKRGGRHVEESFLKQVKNIWRLRKRKFDLVIDLKWKSERASLLTFLSGAKVRIGYWEKFYNRLYTHSIKHPAGRYHEVQRNLDVIRQIGIKISEENPTLFISDTDRKFVQDFYASASLTKAKTICIHPGASKPNRAWLPERYVELSRIIISKYDVDLLITWGAKELALAQKIVGEIGKGAVLAPETSSIAQLGALIENCSLFVSVCTGPMNVANAVKTPVVALLGSSDPLDWAPYGEIHRVIKSPYVLPEYTDEEERRALDEISVENVLGVVEKRWLELHQNNL